MIFFRVVNFLKYLMFSKHRNGHGIHSPFVFMIVSGIIRNKINPDVVLKIEKRRKELISDKRTIFVKDLGAGSMKMNTNLRKVSDIARNSAVTKKYGDLLAGMAAEFGKPYIIEFGTSVGISTMYLAAGSPETQIYTMEGCPATADVARENFECEKFNNIKQLIGSFDELLPEIKGLNGDPGLVFIDGNHRKDPVIDYFYQVAEKSGKSTVIIIDDIHNTKEMEDAWNIIRHHEKVTTTIDINRMGIVFFRDGLTHYNYYINY
jgi:predicted O-methyltransferase YrrM